MNRGKHLLNCPHRRPTGSKAGLLVVALWQVNASAADLTIEPRLCITNSAQQVCELELEFHWQTQHNGDYCLIQNAGQRTLQCWQQDRQGQWRTTRPVRDQELFVLTEDGQATPLAQAVIEVLSTYTDDRRRNRRRKHVWSLM